MLNRNSKTHFKGILSFVILAVMATGLMSCVKNPPKDDEGHATFAREAISVILGRRAYGVDEVEAVADIAQFVGRDVAVEMLMKDPQYIEYWSDQVIDILNLQRGLHATAAQDETCWAEPTTAFSPVTTDLAEWVRDHGPNDPGAPTGWNMADLVRSSILLDDLSPVYRAYLFPLSARLGTRADHRAVVGNQFLQTYLNRDATCMKCHNPEYSTSNVVDGGGDIVWRRLWTIPGHAEAALFGDYSDDVATRARLDPIFRGDVRKNASTGAGIRPWGMAGSCSKDSPDPFSTNSLSPVFQDFKSLGGGDPATTTGAQFGSLDQSSVSRVSLWELEAALRNGVISLQDGYERTAAPSGGLTPDQQRFCDLPIMTPTCTGCHSGAGASAGLNLAANDVVAELDNVDTQATNSKVAKRVVQGNPAASELFKRLSESTPSSYLMPDGSTMVIAARRDAVEDWILNGPFDMVKSDCGATPAPTSTLPTVDPDEAFAFLTATNFVDGVFMAAMGNRLTIDHGFPRNKDQRDMLRILTEYKFVANDWSLKAVLNRLLASDYYARRAPKITQRDTAYEMPPIFDPWTVASPVTTPNPLAHEKHNGQGALADRHRVNNIMRSLHKTLGWKAPERFGRDPLQFSAPAATYPDSLSMDLGQYYSSNSPGQNGITFQSLLALEVDAGVCAKAGHTDGSDDWLDNLVGAIAQFNTDNADAPLTVGEAWSVVKDRLIQDTTIERSLFTDQSLADGDLTEEEAIIAFMSESSGISGGVDLNTPTSAYAPAVLETKLREACGVVLKSPEFLIRNVTPRGYSDVNMPDPPRLTVCRPDEPGCGGYAQSCGHWRSRLSSMGKHIWCGDRTVRNATFFVIPNQWYVFELEAIRAEYICPSNICRYARTSHRTNICLRDPQRCQTVLPTPFVCDPRGEDCGSTGRVDVNRPAIMNAWYEGAIVRKVQGVEIRSAGSSQWSELDAGQRLEAGDVLSIAPQASLRLVMDERTIDFGPTSSYADDFIAKAEPEANADEFEKKQAEVRAAAAQADERPPQILVVNGPSAERILNRQAKRGTLNVSEMREAYLSESFESGPVTDEIARRLVRLERPVEQTREISIEEINRLNADLAGLHPGDWEGGLYAGVNQEDEIPPSPGADKDPRDGGEDSVLKRFFGQGMVWLIILVAFILAILFLLIRRRR